METLIAKVAPCIFSKDCRRGRHSSAECCWIGFSFLNPEKWIRGLEEQAIARTET